MLEENGNGDGGVVDMILLTEAVVVEVVVPVGAEGSDERVAEMARIEASFQTSTATAAATMARSTERREQQQQQQQGGTTTTANNKLADADAAAAAARPVLYPRDSFPTAAVPVGDVAVLARDCPELRLVQGMRSGVTGVGFVARLHKLRMVNMDGCRGPEGAARVSNAAAMERIK